MKLFAVFAVILFQASRPCIGRSVEQGVEKESVVSVYTTQTSSVGVGPSLDVYHQIANNIAEKITSPIYRFFGFNANRTEEEKRTKEILNKIEVFDGISTDLPDELSDSEVKPIDNDISEKRDVEELSDESLKRIDIKPEKLTLYSNYLPPNGRLKENRTIYDVADDVGLEFTDEIEPDEPREGPFVYVLELLGSIAQLVWGGITSIFKPKSSS